jgi:hypothetical protein
MDASYSRHHRQWWMVVAVTVAMFTLLLSGSVSPADAQSARAGATTPAGSSAAQPDGPLATPRAYLPAVFKGYAGPPTIFGVQLYSSPTSASAALPLAAQGHVTWIRWPIGWYRIEPVKGQYQWDWLDAALLALYRSGFKIIVTVDGNPAWAATYPGGPIDKVNISEFTQFVGALVERYDGDGVQDAPGSPVVDYWEFYNEPDNGSIASAEVGNGYWGHYGTQYAQMLCAVFPAVHAASPHAKVLFGGIAYDYFDDDATDPGPFVRGFLDDVLAAGGGQCMDVMNFHYYPAFEAKWTPYGPGLNGKANYIRNKLASYGVTGLPLVVTEAGHHSNNYPTWPSTPDIQAGYVVKLFTQSLASELDSMIWWTWSDYDIYQYAWGANGLLDRNLQPKPSYYAFQTAAVKIGEAVFQHILTSGELEGANVQAYLFSVGHPLYVVWSNSGSSETVKLPGSFARVLNYRGNTVSQVTDGGDGIVDGRVRISVGSIPVYVEVTP